MLAPHAPTVKAPPPLRGGGRRFGLASLVQNCGRAPVPTRGPCITLFELAGRGAGPPRPAAGWAARQPWPRLAPRAACALLASRQALAARSPALIPFSLRAAALLKIGDRGRHVRVRSLRSRGAAALPRPASAEACGLRRPLPARGLRLARLAGARAKPWPRSPAGGARLRRGAPPRLASRRYPSGRRSPRCFCRGLRPAGASRQGLAAAATPARCARGENGGGGGRPALLRISFGRPPPPIGGACNRPWAIWGPIARAIAFGEGGAGRPGGGYSKRHSLTAHLGTTSPSRSFKRVSKPVLTALMLAGARGPLAVHPALADWPGRRTAAACALLALSRQGLAAARSAVRRSWRGDLARS